jgi:tetratricopeptide (TPR) repeat protein
MNMQTKSTGFSNMRKEDAWTALRSNSPEEAIRLFESITTDNAKDASAWYGWGLALSNLNRFEEAIVKYTIALNYKPEMVEALHNLGYCYVQMKEYTLALRKLNQAYELGADKLKLHRLRGFCHLQLKHYSAAKQEYDKAINIQADHNYKAYFERGIAQMHLQRPFDAYRDFQVALQTIPENTSTSTIQAQIQPWITEAVQRMKRLQEESNNLNNAVRKTLEAFY